MSDGVHRTEVTVGDLGRDDVLDPPHGAGDVKVTQQNSTRENPERDNPVPPRQRGACERKALAVAQRRWKKNCM
ncbi:hypothetical protein GCM10029964_037890 [Kibdelosporangium lantanae]